MIYIKNAELCTPFETVKNSHLVIDGKTISRIQKKPLGRIPAGTSVIDARGRLVCPGFIDVHLQGAGGYDFLDAVPAAVTKISQTLAMFGTTAYLATTVFKNSTNGHIKNIITSAKSQVTSSGARCVGIHLEGPFVNPARKGMIRPDGIRGCSLRYFNKVVEACGGKLKMMTIAPELKGAAEIIKGLKARGIIVSFGHSDATYEETVKGIRAGISHVTHIFNAARPLHHREPSGLGAVLLDDNVSVQLISDGVHIHPVVIRLLIRLKGVKNIILITDSMSSQGLPDGKYTYDGWAYESRSGACRYKDGTLIGTALPLNKMIQRFMKFGNVTLCEAIGAATINPARVLGIDGKKGSIEEGKDGDVVIMDKNFDVSMTIIGGKIIYGKSSLV